VDAPPLSYADFARWARDTATDQDAAIDAWRDRMADAPEHSEFPVDATRPAVPTHRGARRYARLDPSVVTGLRRLAHRHRSTLYAVMLAAFGSLLARYAGQEEVVVATLTTVRSRPELEPVVGYFVNTVPVRLSLAGDPDRATVVERARESVIDALSRAAVPYELIVRELRADRAPDRPPIAQTLFNLHEQTTAGFPDALDRRIMEGDLGGARADVAVDVTCREQAVDIALEYATDLFDDATAGRILDHYLETLAAFAADPSSPAGAVPLSPAPPRDSVLLPEVPGTKSADLLHRGFIRQAAATPEAIAVACAGVSLTYAELDRRTDAVAGSLRRRGIGPEALVGVSVPRSVDLVVALLGVLKAGGAYVPLDPSYPAERLRQIGRAHV